jgi:hypothetical protein
MLPETLARPMGLSLIYLSLMAMVGMGLAYPKGEQAPSHFAYIRHF